MRVFKNISLQGFSVPFATPEGIKYVFIGSKNSFTAPDNWTSNVANTLVTRRMFKITTIHDPVPVVVETALKSKKIKTTPRENR